MTQLAKIEEQKQEIDYYKSLVTIASKSGTSNMSPDVMLNIMMTAKDLGISPLKAINGGFYVVNGKISMSTALMADRIRKEGHSIKIPEWTNLKCTIIGVRKDNGDSVKFEFTMDDAVSAGLTGSPTWKKFPKQMLYNRAMSTLARTLFPDVVGNAYSEDEKWDIMNVPPERRPMEDPDVATTINMVQAPPASSIDALKSMLEKETVPTEFLETYLKELSEKKGQTVDQIVEAACNPHLFAKFKSVYAKDLIKRSETVA